MKMNNLRLSRLGFLPLVFFRAFAYRVRPLPHSVHQLRLALISYPTLFILSVSITTMFAYGRPRGRLIQGTRHAVSWNLSSGSSRIVPSVPPPCSVAGPYFDWSREAQLLHLHLLVLTCNALFVTNAAGKPHPRYTLV